MTQLNLFEMFENGRYTEVIEAAPVVLSELIQVMNLSAIAAIKTEQVSLAEKYWRIAMFVDPESLIVHENLFHMYFDTKQYESALFDGRKMVQIHPDKSLGYEYIADVYRAMGSPKEAYGALQLAIIYNDSRLPLLLKLGNILTTELHRLDDAIEVYKKAILLNPEHINTKITLINLLKNLGHEEEAKKLSIELDADYPDTSELAAITN